MSAPAPLTPPGCDLQDFPRMMIDITRLRRSDFDATPDDAAWRAGLNLWFSAWHSVPAGSLTDDDATLAKAAGLGRDLRTWRKVRTAALRGFVLCSDGLLYHSTVCEIALESWIEKLQQRLASGSGNAKRWGAAFDLAEVESDIQRALDMLAALAPGSKALAKARRRRSKRDVDDTPGGTDSASHRDADGVPPGMPMESQETGTGTGTGNKDTEADASAGKPAKPDLPKPSSPIDLKAAVFTGGVSLLTGAGIAEPNARSMIGLWKKSYRDADIIDALSAAQAEGTPDPVAFITKTLETRNGTGHGRPSGWLDAS